MSSSRVPFAATNNVGGGSGNNSVNDEKKIIGEEYVAYTNSATSQFSPLIAVCKYDGTTTIRDMVREDISRINDDNPVRGGWIFRKSSSNQQPVKRFGLIRNEFLFFFHNPANDKPIGLIPLKGTQVYTPPNGDNSFETTRQGYNATQGFEFEISHSSRDTLRLYALSEEERVEWVKACESHSRYQDKAVHAPPGSDNKAMNRNVENIVITTVRLNGFVTENINNSNQQVVGNEKAPGLLNAFTMNPFATPGSAKSARMGGLEDALEDPYEDDDDVSIASSQFSDRFKSLRGKEYTSSSSKRSNKLKVNSMVEVNYKGYGRWYQGRVSQINADGTYDVVVDILGAGPGSEVHESKVPSTFLRLINGVNMMYNPEEGLQNSLKFHEEGRLRMLKAKERRRKTISYARVQEEANPMTLAEMMRLLLFYVDEELAEDFTEDSPLQIPHLKGDFSEALLITVYQCYCNEKTGFMALEEFIDFMEDSGILNTHAPHDDNDEATEEFKLLLDPLRLLSSIPRNLGYTNEMLANIAKAKANSTGPTRRQSVTTGGGPNDPNDIFMINFTQFYQLVLKISSICYSDLYAKDPTWAMHKIMQESILPLYGWCQNHIKAGSTDVLVKEERIPILAVTYAPNLWKLFLMYARDPVGKALPTVHMSPFPEPAQFIEKVLHGVPEGCPYRPNTAYSKSECLVINESEALRFCFDYGFIPHLMTKKHAKEIFNGINREKRPFQVARVIRPNDAPITANYTTSAAVAKNRRQSSLAEMQRKADDVKPMHFGTSAVTSGKNNKNSVFNLNVGSGGSVAGSVAGSSVMTAPLNLHPGLSFTEFIEFICRIADEGLAYECYRNLFPTPVSRILAIFTVWGVADLKRLQEVKSINTEYASH